MENTTTEKNEQKTDSPSDAEVFRIATAVSIHRNAVVDYARNLVPVLRDRDCGHCADGLQRLIAQMDEAEKKIARLFCAIPGGEVEAVQRLLDKLSKPKGI